MQEQINQLISRIDTLERQLSIATMPFELKEIMRNENVSGEDTSVVLTQSYPVVAAAVDAPLAYLGTLLFKNKGREYIVPYLLKR